MQDGGRLYTDYRSASIREQRMPEFGISRTLSQSRQRFLGDYHANIRSVIRQ
jgi:hypothetical protein